MLGRFRSALYNAIGTPEGDLGLGIGAGGGQGGPGAPVNFADTRTRLDSSATHNRVKYAYQRPVFLQLFTDDEIQVTADHMVRPIMVPRDLSILPWYTGYAEAINAGKSIRNEDQGAFHRGVLRTRDAEPEIECNEDWEIPYIYFGIFDGHAGSGCAVTAANELHQVVHNKLMACLAHLIPKSDDGAAAHFATNGTSSRGATAMWFPSKDISAESFIIGALESAFWEMDQQIGEDKKRYKMLGGCTALVSLFILGKLYVANAGDSRGCLCRAGGAAYPMSYDFTPVSERQRLQQLGYQKPHLMGSEYTHLDFYGRKPASKDLGKRVVYRDAHMTGWGYKEITQDDLRFPLVYGEGKRSRLLATIGVTRGFGDHDLKAQSGSGTIYIKPFLTPQPEVRVLDVENEEVTEADVLVMATDGLWDVVSNERVSEIVDKGLRLSKVQTPKADEKSKYKFISVAQELVMAARGKLIERNWRQSDESPATIDDISVFAIPILPYKEEYANWKKNRNTASSHRQHQRVKNGPASSRPEEQTNLSVVGRATDLASSEMEVEAAEEAVVTVNEVSLAIKDEEESGDDSKQNGEAEVDDDDEDEEQPQK